VAEWRERGYELGRERRKRAGLSWAAGRKKKKKGKREWVGLERDRERESGFHFFQQKDSNNSIQI